MARKFKSKLSEYNYYAKMINRNLEKLAKKYPESRALERYKGEFELNPEPSELMQKLKKARQVYKSGATSIVSERRSVALAIAKLKAEGIDYVNKSNFKSFFNFLDDARARGLATIYNSTQLIEAIKQAKDKGLRKADIEANIDYWANKKIKYDRDGKVIEPLKYSSLKVISGKRLKNYKAKMKDRAKREAKRGY